MTNEEAIEYLIDIPRSYGVRRDDAPCNAIDIAINSIQENTKLKAEINRLNGKSEMYRDMADSFCNSNIELKAEIEQWQSTNLKLVCELIRVECENHQLKSELEQSVKLPCKVGDVVYWKDMSNYMDCIISCIEIEQSEIYFFLEKDNMNFGSVDINDFGKTIFLTREEAEQSLKGAIND